jgi:hypothetical protein
MILEVCAQKYAETVNGLGKSFVMTGILLMAMDAIRHAKLKNAGCAQWWRRLDSRGQNAYKTKEMM